MKVRLTRSGLHLYDRVTGLNILLDEVRVPRHKWSLAPRFVSIALTNTCDLDCPFCYAPKHRASLRLRNVLRWAHELSESGCLGIGFGGGEPTIYPEFASLCRKVAQETELAVSFTSHGHHLTTQLCELLEGSVHFARLSMDGIGRTYEALRSRSFDAFLTYLANARAVFPVGINYVVNPQTINDLDATVDLLIAYGVTELLLLPERATKSTNGIDDKTFSILNAWIAANYGRIKMAISESGATASIPLACPFPDEDLLNSYAHIDANGVLKHSSFDPIGIPIGGKSISQAIETLRYESEKSP